MIWTDKRVFFDDEAGCIKEIGIEIENFFFVSSSTPSLCFIGRKELDLT